MVKETIGNRLKSELIKNKLSPGELRRRAEEFGVKIESNSLSNYMSGNRTPDYKTLLALSKVLEKPMTYFLGDEFEEWERKKFIDGKHRTAITIDQAN
ncbi:helix-turn-helix DNA-binding protein [Vibrio phage Marilyn]|nr:helix-turn-helix DNA-binding protein [Vibrio phage Marilyn]WCD55542.1 helix-turn-helix DNA-binding protein [Vibrio phage Fayden]WCD55599.1 helix-turn-helix DNA-binding protein [Vibrio phage Baybae]WCD55658.1 helix-turn-helix DNA-binding protein [Vibrio phage Vaitephage]